jgi:hypothetical protein
MKKILFLLLVLVAVGCTKKPSNANQETPKNEEVMGDGVKIEKIIPRTGGMLELKGIGKLEMSENTFKEATTITVARTEEDSLFELFDESPTILSEVKIRAKYFVRINTSNTLPDKPILVKLVIPEDLRNQINDKFTVKTFCLSGVYSDYEDFFDFDVVPTTLSSDGSTATIELPFVCMYKTKDDIQSHLILAVTPKYDAKELNLNAVSNVEDNCYKRQTISPLVSHKVNSPFLPERIHPTKKEKNGRAVKRPHLGIDLYTVSKTMVHCVMDGVVSIKRENHREFGNYIVIEHKVNDEFFSTLYAHLDKVNVEETQSVKEGELVGLSGKTGNASGDHLHFEMRYKGIKIDPEKFINTSSIQLESIKAIPTNLGGGASCVTTNPIDGTLVAGKAFSHIIKCRDPYNKIKNTQLITEPKSSSTSPPFSYDMTDFNKETNTLSPFACKILASSTIERGYIFCKDKTKSNCVEIAYVR